MKYKHESGIIVSGNHPFIKTFMQVVEDMKRKEKWIEQMKALGYMAAHPDDGWNHREEKEIILSNPYFDRWPDIGDQIIIGDSDKYKSVTITGIRKGLVGNLTYYKYK